MQRIGQYDVEQELGRGGMGVVYRVRHTGHGQPLALKLIQHEHADEEALQRFVREAEVLARVRHKGVLRIHALNTAPEGPYMVTELVEGTDLRAILEKGPLPQEEALRILHAVADAVEAIHAQGILHRDLKPANVMLRADGSPVVLDLGIARDQLAQTLTRTGEMLGTPHYMSPEQADSQHGPVARTSDVYGLGTVLYAMLTGHAPFRERNGALAVMHAVLLEEPVWPELPRDLDAVLKKAMAKRPEDRYSTAADLRDDLARLRAGTRPLALTTTPRRVPLVAGLGALVVLGCGVAVAATWNPPPTTDDPPPSATPSDAPSRLTSVQLALLQRAERRELPVILDRLEQELPGDPALARWRSALHALHDLSSSDDLLADGRAFDEAFGDLGRLHGEARRIVLQRGLETPRELALEGPRNELATSLNGRSILVFGGWASGYERVASYTLPDGLRQGDVAEGFRCRGVALARPNPRTSQFDGSPFRSNRLVFFGARADGWGKLVSVDAGGPVATHDVTYNNALTALSFSPDEDILAAGFQDGAIVTYSISGLELQDTPKRHEQRVNGLWFARHKQLFAISGEAHDAVEDLGSEAALKRENWFRHWDLAPPVPRLAREERLVGKPRFLIGNADRSRFLIGISDTYEVSLHDGVSGARLHKLSDPELTLPPEYATSTEFRRADELVPAVPSPPVSAVFSPSGDRIYVLARGRPAGVAVWVYDGESLEPLARFTRDRDQGFAVDVSPDGTQLYTLETRRSGASYLVVRTVDLPPRN